MPKAAAHRHAVGPWRAAQIDDFIVIGSSKWTHSRSCSRSNRSAALSSSDLTIFSSTQAMRLLQRSKLSTES